MGLSSVKVVSHGKEARREAALSSASIQVHTDRLQTRDAVEMDSLFGRIPNKPDQANLSGQIYVKSPVGNLSSDNLATRNFNQGSFKNRFIQIAVIS